MAKVRYGYAMYMKRIVRARAHKLKMGTVRATLLAAYVGSFYIP
jgi:hypothetical protein